MKLAKIYHRDIVHGDCREVLKDYPDNFFDSVVCDPPYGLEFMGKEWDRLGDVGKAKSGFSKGAPAEKGIRGEIKALPSYNASGNIRCRNCNRWKWGHKPGDGGGGGLGCECLEPDFPNVKVIQARMMQEWHFAWATEVFRVLKPGGYLLAFGGTRTSHRLACAVEDAGFEIRDSIVWIYGSGFPKSLDIGKAIDKRPGVGLNLEFARDLARIRKEAGLSIHDVSEVVVGAKTGICWNWERGQFPEYKHWEKLKRVLPFLNEKWGQILEEAERNVVGRSTHKSGIGNDTKHYTVGGTKAEHYDITSPATPEAQQWDGWGTALKPAHEPILLCRKPLSESTVAANVLKHGTGGINIDASRIGIDFNSSGRESGKNTIQRTSGIDFKGNKKGTQETPLYNNSGRWPANVILQHYDECTPVMVEREISPVDKYGIPIDPEVQAVVEKVQAYKTITPKEGHRPNPVVHQSDGNVQFNRKAPGFQKKSYTGADGKEEVAAWDCHPDCPIRLLDEQSGITTSGAMKREVPGYDGDGMFMQGRSGPSNQRADTGGASRFFYKAKAGVKERFFICTVCDTVDNNRKAHKNCTPAKEIGGHGRLHSDYREENTNFIFHPTQKPVELIRYLVRLVTPPGGYVLDPFVGSGTLGVAAKAEGFNYLGIDQDPDYCRIARYRGRLK